MIGNPDASITNISDLENATPQDASFLGNPRYLQAMQNSLAGVVFIDPNTGPIEGRNFLIHDNPSIAFQKLIDEYYSHDQELSAFKGVHPTAVIHSSCKIGKNVTIGPHAVLDQDVSIGDNTFIGSGTYIGPHCVVGENCILHPRVTIREKTLIGNRVILQPGVVIGSCGFGYVTDGQGHHTKINQVGNVQIEDDVEVGANATIDRARFKSTKIGRGTKIDNMVMVAHNVTVGDHSIIVAQTGIAGSTEIGKHVILAGQTAIAGHLKIADGTIVTGKSGVAKSITKAGKYGGIPAMPLAEYNRNSVFLRNIESYVNEIKELRELLKQSTGQNKS